jgi:hypothetical protein
MATKLAYMWRDVERRASLYGLPINVPTPYSLKEFDLANRIVGAQVYSCNVPPSSSSAYQAQRLPLDLERAEFIAVARESPSRKTFRRPPARGRTDSAHRSCTRWRNSTR